LTSKDVGKPGTNIFHRINGIRISNNFIVAPRPSDEVIIRANTLHRWRIKLDLEHDRVIIDKRMARLPLG